MYINNIYCTYIISDMISEYLLCEEGVKISFSLDGDLVSAAIKSLKFSSTGTFSGSSGSLALDNKPVNKRLRNGFVNLLLIPDLFPRTNGIFRDNVLEIN